MDDDSAGSALASRTQVLVVPASVPETGFAGEKVRVPGRVIVQDDEHLALEVLSLEIVPLVFRCLDAVTDEHQFRVFDTRLLLLYAAGGDELVPLLQRHLSLVVAKGPLVWRLRRDTDQVEGLLPGTVRTAGFESELLELRDKVRARSCVAGTARTPPLVLVVVKLYDVPAHEICRDLVRRFLGGIRTGHLAAGGTPCRLPGGSAGRLFAAAAGQAHAQQQAAINQSGIGHCGPLLQVRKML